MKTLRHRFLATFVLSATALTAQTLYVPSGTLGSSSNGNVGVGTSSPNFKVEVVNDNFNAIRATGNSTNSVGIFVQNTVTGGRQYALVSSGGGPAPVGSLLVWDDTAGASRLAINAAGNVGIGTSNPGSKFEANGMVRVTGAATPTTTGGGLELSYNGSVGIVEAYNRGSGGLPLYVYGYPTSLVGGNVGIGTTSPTAKLEVAGSAFFTSRTVPTAGAGLEVFYSNGLSYLLSYDRTNSTYKPLGLDAADFEFIVSGSEKMRVAANGNVGIGTTSPTHKLAVNGSIRAKEVIVDTGWSDYVFADNYRLAPLSEIESHIKVERHLPGIPSAAEVAERGVSMGEMQSKLLAKIEELTLHVIAQEKRAAAHEKRTTDLENENQALRREIISLRNIRD